MILIDQESNKKDGSNFPRYLALSGPQTTAYCTIAICSGKFELWYRNMQVISEVLEGSSGEDEVEDETFGRIFPRSRTRRGEEFFPFPQPFRGRDEEFLGISAFFSAILRTRLLILVFRGQGRDEEFCLIPRPFPT